MTFSPTDVHATLDDTGLLDDAHGAGCYALEVTVPDAVDAVQRAWLASSKHPLPDAYAEQLAAADSVEYVGASPDVYARLMDHARGDVRKSSLLATFDAVGVTAVWPEASPFEREVGHAMSRSTGTRAVWANGDLF